MALGKDTAKASRVSAGTSSGVAKGHAQSYTTQKTVPGALLETVVLRYSTPEMISQLKGEGSSSTSQVDTKKTVGKRKVIDLS